MTPYPRVDGETGKQSFERRLRYLDAVAVDPDATPEQRDDARADARQLRKMGGVIIGGMVGDIPLPDLLRV